MQELRMISRGYETLSLAAETFGRKGQLPFFHGVATVTTTTLMGQ